jgi:O-acetyl-ADP-ribose deacetylase (regulator of RNase III)
LSATKVLIIMGDLVEQDVDAIVNAANNALILGGGVAGAIRRRGGPTIQVDCDRPGPVKVGEAAIPGAGELRAKYVIHAASMALGGGTDAESLRSSIDHALRLAHEHGVRTLAIPAVGTGIAGFPMDECARIMAGCIRRAIAAGWSPDEVRIVLFDESAKKAFEHPFQAAFSAP